jgi:hypothetical protein
LGVFTPLCRVIQWPGENQPSSIIKEEPMKPNHFTLAFAYLNLLWLLLGGLSVPAAAQGNTAAVQGRGVFTITFQGPLGVQTVEVHHADGSISSAEFAGEFILYPDGRANGGWGLRELGTAPALTLYRVVAGQLTSDNIFTFTAQSLSPLPADEITISLRPALGQFVPTGSVKFTIDGIPSATGEPLSFVTQGRVLELPTGSSPDFHPIYINAPPQTVVVQTLSGSYTANFANVALVFPSGDAIGTLELPAPSGNDLFVSRSGTGILKSTDSGTTWSLIMQRARAENAKLGPGDEIIITIRPDPAATEPCRIYDIVGSQVNAQFEAQASITIF